METMYFVLGVLSIIAVAFVAVIVWGLLKINQLSKQNKNFEQWTSNYERSSWDAFNNMRREYDDRLREMDRQAYSIMNSHQREIEDKFKTVQQDIEKCHAYTDSRIDKLLGTVGAKQLNNK